MFYHIFFRRAIKQVLFCCLYEVLFFQTSFFDDVAYDFFVSNYSQFNQKFKLYTQKWFCLFLAWIFTLYCKTFCRRSEKITILCINFFSSYARTIFVMKILFCFRSDSVFSSQPRSLKSPEKGVLKPPSSILNSSQVSGDLWCICCCFYNIVCTTSLATYT